MLTIDNISKTYTGADLGAVSNVSFSVKDNEILALVGKSGSGKSTILQIVAGLMKPDNGKVLFSGEELENPEEQLIAGHKDIKMVFQDFQLKPNMTVEENVRYMLLQFDKAYQIERTNELLTLCGLNMFYKRKPNELSGGQKQRLSIACALAEDPKLLLMDEPFSNLDPLTKEDLLMELVDIVKSQGLSLIFVTHDTRDAMLIADNLAFLSDGLLIQNDTVSKIYNQPCNVEVAGFFGRINDVSEITGDKNTFVRAEKLMITKGTNGYPIELLKSIFVGDKYFHEGISQKSQKSQKRFYLYSIENLSTANSRVHIHFHASDILQFAH